jgi:Flp pilus assembly protein TadG
MTVRERFRKLRKRMRADADKGSAAIEFAMVAPVFFVLLLGIFEAAIMFFSQAALQNAMTDMGRLIRTGQTNCFTGTGSTCVAMTQAQFRTAMCDKVAPLIACGTNQLWRLEFQFAAECQRDTQRQPEQLHHRQCLRSGAGARLLHLARRHAGPVLVPGQHGRRQASGDGGDSLPQRAIRQWRGGLLMRKRFRGFRKDKSGLAAVEFAMILPLMITLFFGVVEISLALACRANVTNVAAVAADLVAQESVMTTSDVTNVFGAANAMLYPYDTSVAKITVSSIVYDTATASLTSGKVGWSCAKNATAKSVGDIVTLPAGLMTANSSVIMAEIIYNYTSPTTKFITGTKVMTNTFYTKPRRVASIAAPSSCT